MRSVLRLVPMDVAATVDLSGKEGNDALARAISTFDELRSGEVLRVISGCAGVKDRLFAWVEETGNDVVKIDTRLSGETEFYVRKGRSPDLAASVLLDMRGAACPGPVVEARKILAAMQPGEMLKLVSSCPAARREVETWIVGSRYELLDARAMENGTSEFYIRKK